MVIRDFRIGNLILSDYAFGLNSQQFEILTANNNGSKFTYTIDQYPRNLIKVKVVAEDVFDSTDPANPVTLTEFPFDLVFTNILEGAEGIILVDNSTATTKLKFEPTIQIDVNSNLSIRENGNTILRFVYENGIFYIQSDYKPISVNLNKTIELDVDNSMEPIPNKRFNTLKNCIKYIIVNASISIYDGMFSADSAYESVIVNVHYGNGIYPDAFYVPRLGSTGVHFRGIPNASGLKPIIDATNITNQFRRTVNIYESRQVALSDLHFKRADKGSVMLLVTRDSNVRVQDCTFENADPADPKDLIQVQRSFLRIGGEINIISASGNEGKMLVCDGNASSLGLSKTFSNPNNLNSGVSSMGLSIKVNTPITWQTIFATSNYAKISVNGSLDDATDGIPNYNSGDILYTQLADVQSGAEVTNNSLSFPG